MIKNPTATKILNPPSTPVVLSILIPSASTVLLFKLFILFAFFYLISIVLF
jgi:hypothetical protein